MTSAASHDPRSTDAWGRLAAHATGFDPDLRAWFADDPDRVDRLTHTVGDLHVDLSKNLLDDTVLDQLLALAEQTGVQERRDAMIGG